MSRADTYKFERSSLFGSYESIVMNVNGYFAMQFTVKHGESEDDALIGYMVNNPYTSEYYKAHGIEPVESSACLDNMSASCYVPFSDSVADEIENLMIRVYGVFCNNFAVSRFGNNNFNIESFFEM